MEEDDVLKILRNGVDTMITKKRILPKLMAVLMVFAFMPVIVEPVYAGDSIPEPDVTYTGTGAWEGTLEISENKTIKLSNVIHSSESGSPIKITGGAIVNLIFEGGNSLTASASVTSAGIEVDEGSAVNLYGLDGAILTVTGGKFSAGIGGIGYGSISVSNTKAGNINIYSGTIRAVGGDRGAGIGSGYHSSAGDINIYGGIVTAIGKGCGAGIGSGYGTNGGADQGAGVGFYNGGNITISGGTVRAASWDMNFDNFDQYDPESLYSEGYSDTWAAGIGGGYGASSGNIIIEGDADVIALGSCGGAGIGTGRGTTKLANYDASNAYCNIIIRGNTKVVAMATEDRRSSQKGHVGGTGIGLGRHWALEDTALGSVVIAENANVYAFAENGANGIGAGVSVGGFTDAGEMVIPPFPAHLESLSISDGCTVVGVCGKMDIAREGIDEAFNTENIKVTALSFTDEFFENTGVGNEGRFFTDDKFPVKVEVISDTDQQTKALFALQNPAWTRVGVHLPSDSRENVYYKIKDYTAKNGIGVLLAHSDQDNGFRFGNGLTDVTNLLYEKYNIEYHLNEGKNASSNPNMYAVYGPEVKLADPKRSGYTFEGWFDNEQMTGSNVKTIPVGSVGNKEFWAKWKKNAEPASVTKVSGTLLAKITAKGKSSLIISWTKVNNVDGYDVFFAKCGEDNKVKLAKTIKGNKTFKWTKKSLKKKTGYKAIVKAWVKKNGKKTYVKASPRLHAYTSGGTKKFTNPKKVTVNKTSVSLKSGKTYKIKASVTKLQKGKTLIPKGHDPKLRYISSNKKIATVSKSGKITAKSKGNCKIYVIAVNGARKAIKITVK